MINRPYAWDNNRRFNTYTGYIRQHFGGRVQKLTIDAGFTCPNRDGTKGRGGCTYCNNDAFNPSYCLPEKSVTRQIEEGMSFHRDRYKNAKGFLAYFQAYSNTYAPLDKLKVLYEEALSYPGILGVVIGTRPDCVDDDLLDYLSGLNETQYVSVEYGIESCFDDTLERINRGHDFEASVRAIEKTAGRGIRTGGHVIAGLPGEGHDRMMASADILSGLPLHSVKFHQLQIVKGTRMGEDYKHHPDDYHEFGLDEYLELMVEVIENLRPDLVVERIAGESVPRYNLRPGWGLRYDQVLNRFEALLEEKDTWQGKKRQGTG
ncbi:MAG TPA: TIGR01212 family radical SAM protein [Bacteroidales bacterium]|nr:TIGR01212 family radical SAM protein [Bacteroidales bacterium]